jgi:hypothetical protein
VARAGIQLHGAGKVDEFEDSFESNRVQEHHATVGLDVVGDQLAVVKAPHDIQQVPAQLLHHIVVECITLYQYLDVLPHVPLALLHDDEEQVPDLTLIHELHHPVLTCGNGNTTQRQPP